MASRNEIDRVAMGDAVLGAATGHPRLRLRIPPGRHSANHVRPALEELMADVDPVVIEQTAFLVGAMTSGGESEEPSAPFELELWVRPGAVAVTLRDPEFALHRSDGDLVRLDRSMVTGWRLKLLERLADRWSVGNEDGLTLRFELAASPRAGDESAALAARGLG